MLHRWLTVSATVGVLGLLSGCGGPVSVARSASSSESVRALVQVASRQPFPPGFYGVNDDYQGAASFAGLPRPNLLATLAPSALRWPGGTEADFFDWTTGRVTLHPRRFAFTVSVFAQDVAATHAVPILDLDLIGGTPATQLGSQIRLVEAARQQGLPVHQVELGNELYSGRFRTLFPSGAAYAAIVARWAQALHQTFPGLQVAADACLPTNGQCPPGWNAALLALPPGPSAPDAFIVHDYPGAVVRPFTRAQLPLFFAGVDHAVTQLAAAVRSFRGRAVWLTEYNFRGPYRRGQNLLGNPAQTSNARALYVAAFALQLPRIPHLATADFWSACAGGLAYRAWNPGPPASLTPVGVVVAWVDRAARGATATAAVDIRPVPLLPGGLPAVVGQAFWPAQGSPHIIWVNLSAETVTLLPHGPLRVGAVYRQVAVNPLAHPATAPPIRSGRVDSSGLVLPPYSLTAVGVRGLP
jgi:hypothetical protein